MVGRTADKDRMNTEMAEPQVTRRKRTWLLVAACLVVLALIAWFTGAIGSRRPVTILRDNASFENAVSRILNKLPSGPRDSLRKLKFRLFGPPKIVIADVNMVNFDSVPATVADNLGLGAAALTANGGLQIWIVSSAKMEAYRPAKLRSPDGAYWYAQIISSRVNTFSGHKAQVTMTAQMPEGLNGYVIDLLPRVRNEATDLSVRAQYLEGPASHIIVTARLNLPKDCGAIILKQNPTNPTNTLGIFLQPAVLQIRK